VLFAVAVLHILAALKHHFWDRDDVLVRMLPFTKNARRS
jgi:cytochrome b561